MLEKLEQLSDVLNRDLAGLQLAYVFWLDTRWRGGGIELARIRQNDHFIVSDDEQMINQIHTQLCKQFPVISPVKKRSLAIVNHEQKRGLCLETNNGVGSEPFHLLLRHEYEQRTANNNEPFYWKPPSP